MKQVFLKPNQLIGMIDYPPLHSPQALAEYYGKFRRGEEIQPVPITSIQTAISFFIRTDEKFSAYRQKLNRFLLENNEANYFTFGGKHRSAAATLTRKNIPCIVIENDADTSELIALRKTGKLTGILGIGNTLDESLVILEEHFFEHKRFWTVEQKTKSMIANGDVPAYMLG